MSPCSSDCSGCLFLPAWNEPLINQWEAPSVLLWHPMWRASFKTHVRCYTVPVKSSGTKKKTWTHAGVRTEWFSCCYFALSEYNDWIIICCTCISNAQIYDSSERDGIKFFLFFLFLACSDVSRVILKGRDSRAWEQRSCGALMWAICSRVVAIMCQVVPVQLRGTFSATMRGIKKKNQRLYK